MNARQAAALAISVARRAGITSTPLSVEARGARTVVIFATHVAFVAHDDATTRKTAGERLVLNRLAGRLPVAIPLPVLADGPVCLRTKVVGGPGLRHHEYALANGSIADAYAGDYGALFAALHTAFSSNELDAFVAAGLPAVAQLDLDDVIRGAEAMPDRAIALALIEAHRAQVVAPADRTFLHGDVGSHNLVVDGTGRIAGLFDFEESAAGDRHHEMRWLPSYGDRFVRRVLEVYRARTDAVIDEVRLKRAHALAALAQYGWALRRPDEQHRTGRTPDQTRAWAIEAVTRAAADSS
ncbi:MAG: hypothetical protein DME04_08700 [Candidatus Rokuibacteriota bacterium]|nr:MAG: hypothetical protein DME04_08700 [Candidatus Rokubacteria bacterium]